MPGYACHAYPMEKGQKQKKIIGKLILIMRRASPGSCGLWLCVSVSISFLIWRFRDVWWMLDKLFYYCVLHVIERGYFHSVMLLQVTLSCHMVAGQLQVTLRLRSSLSGRDGASRWSCRGQLSATTLSAPRMTKQYLLTDFVQNCRCKLILIITRSSASAFRAHQYLHIGGLEAAFTGMGLAQPTCTSQARCHTIIRVSHGIRSFINKLIQKQDASSIIPLPIVPPCFATFP